MPALEPPSVAALVAGSSAAALSVVRSVAAQRPVLKAALDPLSFSLLMYFSLFFSSSFSSYL